jgi:hypothetical protein
MLGGIMNKEMETAATLGAIELLISPEYGHSWVGECFSDLGIELTDESREEFDGKLSEILLALAAPLIDQLPPELAAPYRKR